jgi:regulator of sirC expression with transglutaminase-like and TPR domain
VKSETARHVARFQRAPEEFSGSEAYFKMLCLVTVLQQDFGIRYSLQRAQPVEGRIEPNESFYAEAADVFLHGLLGPRRAGTCASLPVLYAAVGRRLGYPLKLVTAKNHLFVRWDGAGERLNIEATTEGMTTFEDEYYRGWPFPMSPEEERTERYLMSLSPAEELSVFLSLRTQCLLAAGHLEDAAINQEHVCRLAPYSANQREFMSICEGM